MPNMSSDVQNNLTTDAVPDAPRKKVTEPVVNIESDEKKSKVFPTYTTGTKKKSSQTNSGTSKPKKSSAGNSRSSHACAKVVNVVNSNNVHVGNNFNLFANTNKNKTEKSKENIARTEAISQILINNEVITPRHINFVSTHLGEGWRNVGANLGYSCGQMDHIYADNKSAGDKEVVYQLLLDWQRVKTDEAKICDLAQALWDADEKDVVRRWAENM